MTMTTTEIMTTTTMTMPDGLNAIREQWERRYQAYARYLLPPDAALVILYDPIKEVWSCHRYFVVGNEWTVSVDRQAVPIHGVFAWLAPYINI